MSKESTEQGKSGRRGAEASRETGRGQQPPQGSNRTEMYGRGEQEEKHSFAPGEAPSEQGDLTHRSPEVIKEHQQGLAGSGTGRRGSRPGMGDRSQEQSVQGEPQSDHTRKGRERTRGDRSMD